MDFETQVENACARGQSVAFYIEALVIALKFNDFRTPGLVRELLNKDLDGGTAAIVCEAVTPLLPTIQCHETYGLVCEFIDRQGFKSVELCLALARSYKDYNQTRATLAEHYLNKIFPSYLLNVPKDF